MPQHCPGWTDVPTPQTGPPVVPPPDAGVTATALSPSVGNAVCATGSCVQDVPSQCSMIAVRPGDLPTAQTLLLASAATPLSPPRPVPPGLGPVGIGTEVHAVPSQCTASGTFGSWFWLVAMPPTAQASFA